MLNSLDDEKILTKKLNLNLIEEDFAFLQQLKERISTLFEIAVGREIERIFSSSPPCYVKVNLNEITWQGKIVYDNSTGGQIDCLVFLPRHEKLLVLELKNKALPTSLRMLNAQKSRFVEKPQVSKQLEKKINGLRDMIKQVGCEPLRSVFPSFTDSFNIDPENIIGGIVTSFVSTEENEKFPVVSLSDIPKLIQIME